MTTYQIILAVCASYGASPKAVLGDGRPSRIAWVRQVAMYCAFKLTGLDQWKIAETFHKERSTISYAVICVEERMSVYPDERRRVESILQSLSARINQHNLSVARENSALALAGVEAI